MKATYDVFLGHASADKAAGVRAFADGLERLGLRTFVDERAIGAFDSITQEVEEAIAEALVFVAWYSRRYPERRACQLELRRAYVAAEGAGEVRDRVLAVNPESGFGHIHPATLRDARIPSEGAAEAIRARVAQFAPGVYDPAQDPWELYYLPDDFTQAHDLAAENPEKLTELKELFWEEAAKYKVLPLLGGLSVFFGILPPMPTITRTTFYGDVENVASGMIPRVYGHSYAIEAELTIPDGGAEGVIVAEADEMGGFSLWVDGAGLLHHSYSMLAVEQYKHVSTKPLPTGEVTVRVQFDADEAKPGTGGNVTLWTNDEQVGEGRMDKTVAFRFSFYAGMDVGRDHGMTVDPAYRDKAPYPFTGTVKKVVFDLKPKTHDEQIALHEATQHVAVGASAAG
jgi:hypothetical protein